MWITWCETTSGNCQNIHNWQDCTLLLLYCQWGSENTSITQGMAKTTKQHLKRFLIHDGETFEQLTTDILQYLTIQTPHSSTRFYQEFKGYSPKRVPTSNMNLAPSLRYRASVAGSSPSSCEGVCAKSFLSQYQHGFVWSRFAKFTEGLEFSLFSFIY